MSNKSSLFSTATVRAANARMIADRKRLGYTQVDPHYEHFTREQLRRAFMDASREVSGRNVR